MSCFYMGCVTRFGTICTTWKTWKNTHGGVLLLVTIKVTLFHECFSRFLNGTKSHNALHTKCNTGRKRVNKIVKVWKKIKETRIWKQWINVYPYNTSGAKSFNMKDFREYRNNMATPKYLNPVFCQCSKAYKLRMPLSNV